MLAVTVCPSLYPTTTTQRLCCFVRATLPGLFLVCVVTDPTTVVCKDIDPLRTTVHRSFSYRLQQAAAVVSVISTVSREDSSCCSTNLPPLVGGS